jgi:hypothetical protein
MPKSKNYSKEDLEIAVAQIKSGSSLYSVTHATKIPFTTLQRHVSKPPEHKVQGRPPFFSEVEEWFVAAAEYSYKCGLPLDRKGIRNLVQQYLKKEKRKIPSLKINHQKTG